MDNEKFVAQSLSSPLKSRISTLPSGAKSNWYYDHESDDVDKSSAIRRGWLERQPSKLFSSRKQKWVVLQEGYLHCFDDERELKSATRTISLVNKTVSEIANNDSVTANNGTGGSGKYIFQISPAEPNSDGKTNVSSKNVDIFGASSEQERKDWMKALKKSMYAKIGGAIFGGSLEDTLNFERLRNPDRIVPELVEECIRFVQENGLECDGIFRLTGKKSLVRKLQEKFDKGERPKLVLSTSLAEAPLLSSSCSSSSSLTSHWGPYEGVDVHSAASLLKCYLLELPEPIIPVDFYVDIMTVVTREYELHPESSIDKISSFLCKMPAHSYNLLRYLCQFLKIVGDNQAQNRMTYQNLAKVFCNAILEPEDNDPALLMGTADNRAKAVTIMMTFFNRIFKDDWKKDDRWVSYAKRRQSRLSKSWDDLSNEEDFSASFTSDQKPGETAEVQTSKKSAKNSKSLEILNSRQSSREEEDELSSTSFTGGSRSDKNRCSGSSTSTISSFLEMLPRLGSSRKGKDKSDRSVPTDVPDSSRSSISSEHFQDVLLRTNQHNCSAINMRRTSSVRDHATREKLRFHDLCRGQSIIQALMSSQSFEGMADEKGQDTDLWHLLEVRPKSLPVDDLIEHFYRLQESLAAEHKKVHDLTREHTKEVERLKREADEQREGREQAVARVVELQSQLESYFLKFGSLDLSEGNTP